jgi:hypothetical protein
MSLSERQELILSKLEESLSPVHLLQNPFLVSQILTHNRIAAAAIASLPSFLKLNASNSEIISCCSRSRFADVVQDFDRFSIVPRFAAVPSILIVPEVRDVANEFQKFIRSINGNERFQLFVFGEVAAVQFEQVCDAMAVWRALRLVPFQGKCVRAFVHSIDLREREASAAQDRQQKKITVEPRAKARAILCVRKAGEQK